MTHINYCSDYHSHVMDDSWYKWFFYPLISCRTERGNPRSRLYICWHSFKWECSHRRVIQEQLFIFRRRYRKQWITRISNNLILRPSYLLIFMVTLYKQNFVIRKRASCVQETWSNQNCICFLLGSWQNQYRYHLINWIVNSTSCKRLCCYGL